MQAHALAQDSSHELLALRLKLGGQQITKRIFVSTGNDLNKRRTLPTIARLADYNVEIYATPGTSRFLTEHGVHNYEVGKISEGTDATAATLLARMHFDLVINILTGDGDYDEKSDARVIRSLAIEKGVYLITDADIAVATINKLIADIERDRDQADAGDMRSYFAGLVHARGGYANYHGHFDKAYLMRPQFLELGEIDMQAKWELYARLKQGDEYAFDGLCRRTERALRGQIEQGVTHCRSLFDADSSVGLKCIEAAIAVREKYRDQIVFEIGTQPLKGVLDPDERKWFEAACERADLVGGLPSRDRPRPEGHLDVIMKIAKNNGQRLDVHVDQENNPDEDETKLLALKTMEHGMEGRVSAVHSISLAAKPVHEQVEIIKMLKDAGISVIVCPLAALSMRPLDRVAPLHNSIAPVFRLIEEGVQVVLGVDNISDFFMPFADGDMWTEVRALLDACRWYNAPTIADIACDKSLFGRPV